MRFGVQRNNIAIAVENRPKSKNPCLTVYVDKESEPYKVASFRGQAEAEWFVEMVREMLKVED